MKLLKDDPSPYFKKNPKKWLVTGVAGFIGSNLLEKLLILDQEVVGLDNFSTGTLANLEDVRGGVGAKWANFRLIEGDISDQDVCIEACRDVNCILHEAALGSVPRSIESPLKTNESNITGFLNMLDAARCANVESFVYAASSSTYGDHPGLPKVEGRIGSPLSPYAVTKYVNELYADVYSRVYSFNSIGLRYFNVFGRRQNPSGAYAAVIPKWILGMMHGDAIYINGDGSTSRDFCYIDNVIQINLLATLANLTGVNRNKGHSVFNVAYGGQTTLLSLFDAIKLFLKEEFPGSEGIRPIFESFRAGDVKHSLADISKAREILGYKPTHDVYQGLAEAVKWYVQRSKDE